MAFDHRTHTTLCQAEIEAAPTAPLSADERQALTNEIISRWDSRQQIAGDIDKEVIVVHRWAQRGSIPAEYDIPLLRAAHARSIPLSLVELASTRWACD